MFKRFSFWIGLLLGGLAFFNTRRLWLKPQGVDRDPLLDLVGDAVVVYDALGVVRDTNAAGEGLFGPDGLGLSHLCYPSGQAVPSGQLPISRVLRTGKPMEGAGYLYVSAEGKTYTLDIRARPLPDGRVVATVHDATALVEGQIRETTLGKREQILRELCRRLTAASDAGELAQSLVESVLALMKGLPGVRVRLYTYESEAKQLTRLASAPSDHPKRPKSHRQTQLLTFPFDASSPFLWSVYVAREPVIGTDVGDTAADSAYALPLLVGGVALGHLAVVCPASDAFAEENLRETLGLITSIAALALAGPRQAAQTADLAGQVEALRAVIGAVGERREIGALMDLVSSQVCRVTGAEVCTLVLMGQGEEGLRLVGTDYREALLFPDRHDPNDESLIGDSAREALKNAKTIRRTGLTNPSFEAGIWRAFAGQSGRHSIVSVPLAAGQGALTVYISTALPEAQVKFLETLAALVSAALPEANPPAERTG